MRRVVALITALVTGAGLLFTAASLAGYVSVLTSRGNSMEPYLGNSDLALVVAASGYDTGDVVAYRSDLLGSVVLHRITATDGERFTLQGDNNSWLDPEQVTADQILGRLAVSVPQGGALLAQLTSPVSLSLMVFALLAGGGTLRSARRRRRRGNMPQHARQTWLHGSRSLSRPAAAAAAAAILAGMAGLGLGALVVAGPAESAEAVPTATAPTLRWDYSTQVPRSAAYDGTTVSAPDPVFRRLADSVDVTYSYTGAPGTIAVSAVLSTSNGWRSTVRLAKGEAFPGPEHDGVVRLDLDEFEQRAEAAARATGMAAGPVAVQIVAQVTTRSGSPFAPALDLTLEPLQLRLTEPDTPLAIAGDATATVGTEEPGQLHLGRWEMSHTDARTLAVALAGGALVVLAGLLAWQRLRRPTDEAAAIRSRYRDLLVSVRPMPTAPGRPVVDVTDFATLVKLAERYGLLVMHWSRSGVETFVVQDEGTTFRYRAPAGDRAASADEPLWEDAPATAGRFR